MKKILLSFGAVALALSVSAQEINNLLPANSSTFENESGIGGWYGWGNSSTQTLADQGYESDHSMALTNPTAGNASYSAQAAYSINLEVGTEYGFRFWAKSTVADGKIQMAYQNSEDTSKGGLYKDVNVGTEWTLCEATFTVSQEGMDRILINFGSVAATYYIDDIEFGPLAPIESGDNPEGVPADYVVVPSNIDAWKSEFTKNVSYEGKQNCVKYTNEQTGLNNYDMQLSVDADYVEGLVYYITFEVIGDPSTESFQTFYQCKDGYKNLGYNDFNTFQITSATEWKPVVIYGKYTHTDEAAYADRASFNLGTYVGTAYFSNIKVYGPESSGVESAVVENNDRVVVYNLQGVKVLDTNNAAAVYGLAKGLYIVNGKKVLVK